MAVASKWEGQSTGAPPAIERRIIPAKIGMVSLVLVVGSLTYPVRGGNAFFFASGPRCCNMGLENMEEAVRRFLPDGMVEVDIIERWALVRDSRIPAAWLRAWPEFSMPSALVEALRPETER